VHTGAVFSCVSDASHFLGAVALLNSLRVVGHDEPFVLLDCGLEPWQRQALAPVATVVPAPRDVAPMLLKPEAACALPAEVAVVLDADVIVTRPLHELIATAAEGRIVVFANGDSDRFFPEWGPLLGLGPPRRQPYVASGHLFVPAARLEFLERFRAAQRTIDLGQTLLANDELLSRSTPSDPFYYPDMDVLNALLATVLGPDELTVVDYRLAPHAPFPGVELVDEATLRCRYADGVEPLVLHHVLRKPWLAAVPQTPYSRLLPRLLLGDDVALRLDPQRVPLRLRHGRLATLDRVRAELQAAVRTRVRGKLGLRPRIAAWRAAASA
jgi:hypothetical protein